VVEAARVLIELTLSMNMELQGLAARRPPETFHVHFTRCESGDVKNSPMPSLCSSAVDSTKSTKTTVEWDIRKMLSSEYHEFQPMGDLPAPNEILTYRRRI
jgi:hypothetical protein